MITAIIPARKGSRRLKNKNIASFGDSNLLIHKIRQLKRVPLIDQIVVSSDSEKMLNMARAEGALTHRTSPEYCDEKTKTFGEVVEHMCKNVSGDHIVWAQVTSPFVTPEQYTEAISKYLNNLEENDSLASVEPVRRHVWNEEGPINYKQGKKHPRSQDLPQWYFVTGVFIAPRKKMIEWKHNIGKNPYKYVLPKISCIDIDDELDLEIAKGLYSKLQYFLKNND